MSAGARASISPRKRRLCELISLWPSVLQPPPDRTPDQWADACRVLPAGSPEPGRFRSSRTPYMIPIVRAGASPKYKRITAVLCAQSGKTESLLNLIGHQLDDNPKPVLYIGPTQKAVESISNDRFIKMFRSAPGLWDKLAKGKKNKITEKFISGVRFGLGWAGSKTELAGHPARLVVVDERDRMEQVRGEGDPVELAEGRISNFADGRVCIVSTPTIGNVVTEVDDLGVERWALGDPEQIASPIWKLWQEGTRQEWAWPCPECNDYFIPRFRHLKWEDGATPTEAAKKAFLA